MVKGFLLALEGLGGSGKTTLSKSIAQWLGEKDIPHILTFEPGGTPAANHLRKLCREGIEGAEPLTPMAEALLFNAARAQHVETVIKPALAEGKVVVCDRFYQSTLGYQGVGRGQSVYTLEQIHHHAIGVYPDMTLMMSGDPAVFNARVSPAEKASDQFDSMKLETHNRIQDYWEQAARGKLSGHDFWLVNAELSQEEMFLQVLPVLEKIRVNRILSIVPGFVENKGIRDTSHGNN